MNNKVLMQIVAGTITALWVVWTYWQVSQDNERAHMAGLFQEFVQTNLQQQGATDEAIKAMLSRMDRQETRNREQFAWLRNQLSTHGHGSLYDDVDTVR